MNFSPVVTNWLPFYWAGFQATVRYTYRIEDLSDLDRVRSEFDENVRRRIRKAQATVMVDHDFSIEELLRLDSGTYARQGLRSPTTPEFVRRLEAACAAKGARPVTWARWTPQGGRTRRCSWSGMIGRCTH